MFSDITTLIFDFGNTLVEYGPNQVEREHNVLVTLLSAMFGACDSDQLRDIRHRQIIAPYSNQLKENDLAEVCEVIVQELYGRAPTPDELTTLLTIRHQCFIESIAAGEGVAELLGILSKKFKLGLLSNFPSAHFITDSLQSIGLADYFDATLISGEVGFVKPHISVFEEITRRLNAKPEECLFIGDNWLADIQGAKNFGMKAVFTKQYVSFENFQPRPGDHQPDAVIDHFLELDHILNADGE